MEEQQNVIIFQSGDGTIGLDVELKDETVWLSQKQMEQLFDKSKKTISEHINNIFKEGELSKEGVVRKFRTTANDGKTYDVIYYNLDIIISVGYRVKSARGTQFRIWATKILKDHIVKGYTLNQKRLAQKGLNELTQTMELLRSTIQQSEIGLDEAKGMLDIILNYSRTWSLLQGYDEDSLPEYRLARDQRFILDADEAKAAIAMLKHELLRKAEASDLFGREKANEFEGIIRNIYQTFGGDDLIPSVEEKAAHLLYYIIKDHPFNDGNKRIGAFLFILFLDKNRARYKPNGELKINDNALVALALMTAKSIPNQKDTVIRLIVNMLVEG
ncbi:MAG: virulence protein RhuM/Fic/DOC family protein [Campylobacterales bacterium]|nr:virulence protein RhuM/Fic/DOC family protein [Campylobacterales bacterium]